MKRLTTKRKTTRACKAPRKKAMTARRPAPMKKRR